MKKVLRSIIVLSLSLTLLFSVIGCQFNFGNDENEEGGEDRNYLDGNSSQQTETEEVSEDLEKVLLSAEKTELTKTEIVAMVSEESDANDTPYYGIGRTVNVITDDYNNYTADLVSRQRVIDSNKLEELDFYRQHVGHVQAESHTSSTMKEFYASANLDYKKSMGVGVSFENVFSVGFSRTYSICAGASYKNTANELFHVSTQYYGAKLVAIDEYSNVKQYEDLLSPVFIDAIEDLEAGEIEASEVLDTFGTHIVVAGFFGGKIACYSYIRNTSTEWDANLALNYERNMGGAVARAKTAVAAGNSKSFSIRGELNIAEENSSEDFMAYGIGGDSFEASSLTDYYANYGKWVDSMNSDKAENSVIVGLPSKSLVSIWDALPEKYATAKEALLEAFTNSASKANNEFLAAYHREYIAPDTSWDKLVYTMNRVNCNENSENYNPNEMESSATWRSIHDNYELGYLNIYGCDAQNGKVIIKNANDFSIKYGVAQNIADLPRNGRSGGTIRLANDTATKIYGIGDYNQKIGHGAYWMRITYYDDSSNTISKANFLANSTKNEYLELLDENTLDESKQLKSIEIVVVYEICYDNWGVHNDQYTNWRCTYTLNF